MALISCAKLQDDLNNHFLTCGNPTGAKEAIGFTEFVISPLNTNGVLQRQINYTGGKKRDVELIYSPRLAESVVTGTATRTCTSANEGAQLSTTYTIGLTEGVSYGEKFDTATMATMCRENPLWIGERIQAMMDVLIRKIASNNASSLTSLVGNFAVGDNDVVGTLKTVKTKKSIASDDLSLNAYEEVLFSAQNAGYCSVPFVFGFGEIYKYFKRMNAGCCANDGLDLGSYVGQNDLVFVADKKIQSAFGTDNFVSVATGAVQWITWLEFAGANMIDTDDYKQTTITDPRTGITFDMTYKVDCGVTYINLKLANKLVGLPTDMYAVGDDFEGVTFVNQYEIVNA